MSIINEIRKFVIMWLNLIKISEQRALFYRYNFIFKIVLTATPFAIIIFIWSTIYSSNANSEIYGYDSLEMKVYVLGCTFCWLFNNFEDVGMQISQAHRNGTLRHFLIKPFSIFNYFFFLSIGKKLLITYFIFPLLLIIVLILQELTISEFLLRVGMFLLFIPFGAFFSYTMNSISGIYSIWLIDATGIIIIINLIIFFLGGGILPLDMFPEPVLRIFEYLPFKYIMYLPSKLLIGNASINVLKELVIITFWLLVIKRIQTWFWNRAKRLVQVEGA